jgi:PhnB protein
MAIKTTTHLNFRGEAKAALTFYQSVFGGQLAALSYADAHAVSDPAEADQIMWGQVLSEAGFHVMAYDVPGRMNYAPGEIPLFVSVAGPDAEELKAYWEKLIVGGTVVIPLAPAAWSPLYGMVKDKFGVTFVMNVPAQQPA